MTLSYAELPLVYSCSGCSNTAQLANQVAVELDRAHIAEMSCIAGVGGGVPTLVRKATSGRMIIAIDGCPLHCVKLCLAQQNVKSTLHYTLTEHNLKKKQHGEFLPDDALRMKERVIQDFNELAEEEAGN